MKYVVDASVLAKALLPEVGQESALTLVLCEEGIILPDIARLETSSAIVWNGAERGLSVAWINDRLCELDNILELSSTTVYPALDFEDDAISLCLLYRHRFPDCLYVALAKHFNLPLLSADNKQIQIAKSEGVKLVQFSIV